MESEKLHFVMVHGFGHGGWCWYKIRTLLEELDCKVTCVDLKGSGMDVSDPNSIFTFQDYNKPLMYLLSNLTHNEKVSFIPTTNSLTGFANDIYYQLLPLTMSGDTGRTQCWR
ncbi:hypothetical protein V6N13_118493 [Hibiscus sabdariffa]|uniref:AB hydrolase-1 domain-containing protein n=2 Tax=Hibiscus sabdariffa TaxID=183260 RepID=A0ABR2BS11_9ROSI